jgi:hypothetical protein
MGGTVDPKATRVISNQTTGGCYLIFVRVVAAEISRFRSSTSGRDVKWAVFNT